MDYPLPNIGKKKMRFISQFEALDIIPYSLAITMLLGSAYIITAFLEITKHAGK